MELNFLTLALAGLVPMVMGFIWYGKLLFQDAWMKQMGFSDEDMKGGNMGLVFLLSYIFCILIAMAMQPMVIHQWGMYSTLMPSGATELSGEALTYFNDFMAKYGDNYRTFKHGALHGVLNGVFLIAPILAIQAMFERKTAKYILINAGYWIVCLALMGGIVCQWG